MDKKLTKRSSSDVPLSIISKLSGGQVFLLPGESADEYRVGLEATISELEAKTPLQIYLAEKIFDCMWWIRRLENQKSNAVITNIWLKFKNELQNPPPRELLASGDWTNPEITESAEAINESIETLLERAMRHEGAFIGIIDARIADRIKAMQGLQASYESLVNRKLMIDRLRLQNENLMRNINAIEMQQGHGDSKADNE